MTHSTSVGRRSRAARIALSLTTILCSGLAAPALAQTLPLYRDVDANGVDLTLGDYVMSFEEGSIGSGNAQLKLTRFSASVRSTPWDRITFHRSGPSTSRVYTIGIGGLVSERFTGVLMVNVKGTGATLTSIGPSQFTYTGSDGTQIFFEDPTGGDSETPSTTFCGTYATGDCDLLPSSITSADGKSTTLSWELYPMYDGYGGVSYDWRLASVTNNFGYSITFSYVDNSGTSPYPTLGWQQLSKAEFRNTNVSSTVQGTVNYSYPSSGTVNVTDMAGNVWQLTATSVKRPGESSASFSVGGSASAVTSVTRDGVTTSYAHTVSGSTGTMVVTDAGSHATTIVSDLSVGRPTSVTDALSNQTTYTYDSYGRLTRVTPPDGNYVNYTLDGRGNVTETRAVAKSGSSLSDIVSTASFPSSCAVAVTCNQPTSVTDARGNTTSYTYSGTHGGVLSVTAPLPTGSSTVQPETRYSYTTIGGAYEVNGVSACRTGSAPSCVGTADEVKVTIGRDASGNVTSVSRGAGDASLTATSAMTYTAMGDLASVDGPLSGTADTSTFRYDAARRRVGAVSADPDGAGALKRRAVRTTYDTTGRATIVESGTVNGTSDSDWAGFSALQAVTSTYTSNRKTRDALSAGATIYGVTDYSYDSVGRALCTATRMNLASLPTDACTAGTAGSDGPDRIVKVTGYDADNRATQVTTAYGTSAASVESTSYTANGKQGSVTDANGNLTTYTYDGFDRLAQTNFPSTTTGAGTSSTTDHEQLGYDPNGNVISRTLRDGNSIGYSFDTLNRVTAKDLPGSEPDVSYSYDLTGALTGAATTSQTLTFGYDALGRMTSQGGPLGTVAMQYDLAGRRTRLTWPDAFYVAYDYDNLGETTAIRENGATSGTGVLATYGYDDLGRRVSLTRGNGTTQSYGYDAVSQLTSLSHDLSGTTSDIGFTFGYNPAGQITSRTANNDAYAWTGAADVSQSYTANGLNQYTAAGSASLTYDARGNLTANGSSSYTYSSENLLLTGPSSASLTYDPLLRLYQESGGGASATMRFQYDGAAMIGEYDTSGALQKRYVHGPSTDEPLIDYDRGSGGSYTRAWLHTDERGSIVAASDDSGATTAIDSYDEYGVPGSGNTGRFGYTGQAWLPSIGMWSLKARIYAPTLGRFMQTDPIGYGDGLNWYSYAHGDPVNWSDPSGTAVGLTQQICTGYTFTSYTRDNADEAWRKTGEDHVSLCYPVFGSGDQSNPSDSDGGAGGDVVVTANARPGKGVVAGLGPIARATSVPQTPLPPFIKSESCRNAASQSGSVITSLTKNVSAIAGAGANYSSGTFNIMAPNGPGSFYRGSFYTVGAGLGLDAGAGSTLLAYYRNMNSFLGTGYNININLFKVVSFSLNFANGGLVGGSAGTGVGAGLGSVTASGTYIYGCTSGRYQ